MWKNNKMFQSMVDEFLKKNVYGKCVLLKNQDGFEKLAMTKHCAKICQGFNPFLCGLTLSRVANYLFTWNQKNGSHVMSSNGLAI